MKTINKLPLILLLLLIGQISLSGQELLDYVEINYVTGTNIINKDVLKHKNGDYYVRLACKSDKELYIEGDTIKVVDLPDSLFSANYINKTIIARFDKNLNYISYCEIINAGFYFTSLAVSSDRVFVSCNRYDTNPNIMVNDSIVITEGDHGGILEFDLDLNFLERKRVSNNFIHNMVASDTILYYDLELNEEYGYHAIEGDTIFNYQGTSFDGSLYYGLRTPVIIRYDYRKDKVESYWKFGTQAYESISNMELDADENILVTGNTRAICCFTINGIDTLETIYSSAGEVYVAKFDKYGNVIYGITTPEIRSDGYGQVMSNNDYTILHGGFIGDTVYVAGDTLPHIAYGFGSTPHVLALDAEGNKLWAYSVSGEIQGGAFSGMSMDSTTVTLALFAIEGVVDIQGNEYDNEPGGAYLIKIDLQTGEVIEHFHIKGSRIQFPYMESVSDDEYRMLFTVRGEVDFNGQTIGSDEEPINYFGDVSFDFLTSIQALPTDINVKIYPNPVLSTNRLYIESPEVDYDHNMLYNMKGELMQQGSLDKSIKTDTLRLNTLRSGIYYLILKNETQSSVHAISVVE